MRAPWWCYPRTTRVSPSLTDWPSWKRISLTTPSSSASTGISIFIDSRMTTVSPSETWSPTATSIFQMLPVMWASMSAMARDNSPMMGPDPGPEPAAGGDGALAAIVAAHNEGDRVGETVRALREAFPTGRIWVADDASEDGTAEAAMLAGAEVVRRGRSHGKGGNVTAAAEAALSITPPPRLVLLCDGDLGASAVRLAPLVAAVEQDQCDLAVAAFSRRLGGGFGLALGFAG